jgi:hypothetical protein
MWYTEYANCPPDFPLKKEQVAPGKGIIGCEMHEINGWGNHYHLENFSNNRVTLSVISYDVYDYAKEV